MSKVDQKVLFRIVDANLNRAKEGLRVIEDICRFILDLKTETRMIKTIRHDLSEVVLELGIKVLLNSRQIEKDVGKKTSLSESNRENVSDIFFANIQRVKESIRVLEEVFKMLNKNSAESIKRLRYRIYAIEKKVSKKL